MRVGFGNDIHRLVEGRPLMLGGIEIPFDKGEDAHSDGDVLLHAISDAILGAKAMGDIGQLFPDDSPHTKDMPSLAILKADLSSAEKSEILQSIEAIQNGEVYLQMPYNSYYTNLEIAYCDAYWVGATCYPEQYKNLDLESKFNEICKTFLGVDFYANPNREDDISDVYYGGFQQIEDLFVFLEQAVK